MAGAVRYVRKKRLRLTDQMQQVLCYREIFDDIGAADIANLADPSTFENSYNSPAVAFYVQPVALP